MWQLGIIIEISSRKELLGSIWSLPRGQTSIIPFSKLPCALSSLVVRSFGGGILCSDFHSSLDLIL